MILQAVVGGFVLDALFGDPAWLPHPVVLMGRCISRLEKFLRARLPGTCLLYTSPSPRDS